VVAVVDALRAAGPDARLAEVGGEAALYADADAVAFSDAVDVATSMLLGAWEEVDRTRAAELILAGLRHTPDPLAFGGAVDATFGRPEVLGDLPGLADVFLARVADRADERRAYIAVDALDGLLRLTLSEAIRPFRLLGLLTDVSGDDLPAFSAAAARRMGVVFLHIAEPSARGAMREALGTLATAPAVRADAEHELGAARLVEALEGATAEVVERGLRDARRHFAAAVHADAARLDAQLYVGALDGVLALVEHRAAADVQAAADHVEDLALTRAAWRAPGRLARWLGDTTAAEREWWMVTANIAEAAVHLDDDIWMTAAPALEAIARAHRATRIAAVLPREAPGLRAVVEPRISEEFVRSAHRRGALLRWAAELCEDDELADDAAALREVVDDPKGEVAGTLAELRDRLDDPDVDAALESLGVIQQQRLERRLETLDGDESVLETPTVRRVRDDLRAELTGRPDYAGTGRLLFDRIVDLTIRFVASRMDVQPGTAHAGWAYLAKPDALEVDLQLDYYDFLKGSVIGNIVDMETPHVGGGRADVRFALGAIKIIAELKRDSQPVQPGTVDTYLNQAGLYQTANVALGVLLILDTSPKPAGQVRSLGQSLWVAEKPALASGDTRRTIVTAVVPGNRPSPSATT
jgi:hypothetical protein